jgi:hypothetical protein
MSKQDRVQATTLKRPANDDKEAWQEYWKQQSQEWRTEPEIDEERQKYLVERRSITPDYEREVFPFKDIRLCRADVEWILATHGNERSPVDWSKESQPGYKRLDLRFAELRLVDLSRLPLERASLNMSHLEGANLSGTHLEEANLRRAYLRGAYLFGAHLKDAFLGEAHMEGAFFYEAHMEGANLHTAYLEGANLTSCFFDNRTRLSSVRLSDEQDGNISLVDIHWGDVNVAVVDWTRLSQLGEEDDAERKKRYDGKLKNQEECLDDYSRALRAYRQLATVLRNQGLNEDAARFTYRAQLMRQKVFWHQHKLGQYLFSGFLDLLAGYGYKPWRSFRAYLLVILAFAIANFIIGHTVGPVLSPLGSFVFSMTSFHGRGFFPGGIGLDDPLTVLAAIEAFVGLLIEVTFIVTLTQRVFGK